MNELVIIQTKLSVPKNQYNSFGKYKYRSQEDILESVKPLLAETKCTLVITDKIVEVGGRVYVKATATLTNSEKESVKNSAYAREPEVQKGMNDAQITGSVSSYARKYCLNGLFCIDDTKDADVTNKHGKGKESDTTKQKDVIKTQIKLIFKNSKLDEETKKVLFERIYKTTDSNKIDKFGLDKIQAIYDELNEIMIGIKEYVGNDLKSFIKNYKFEGIPFTK